DDSIAFLKTTYPEVRIIQNQENGGYAKGYNDALKHLDEDFLCLLNSDVEVTEHWLTPILQEFNSNPDTAIIQPKILDLKKKDHFEYAGAAGGFIDKYAYPYCRGRVFESIEKDTGQYNDTIDIFWASGACLFIRNQTFKTLNGFDETYFAHFEEIDLSWRAFNTGKQIKYVGTSTIYHLGGATLNSLNPKKTYLNFRNSLFTIVKNAHGISIGTILIRLILDGLAGIRFILRFQLSHFFAIIRAHFAFYAQVPKLLKARKTLPQRSGYFQTKSIVWSYFVRKRYS
ncbi:MAG: glycosyltransferase family 2 protein, partial [Psychroserpens sp.]|nr:glycosyltransferase family 2 protein [Psychroserpens sp.]